MGKGKVYAVADGRQRGLFSSWGDCREQVNGYSGCRFKSFSSTAEAEAWLGSQSSPSARSPAYAAPAPAPAPALAYYEAPAPAPAHYAPAPAYCAPAPAYYAAPAPAPAYAAAAARPVPRGGRGLATGTGRAAASTPTSGSGRAAAKTPTSGGGRAAAKAPDSGRGRAAATTPASGSGRPAAKTPRSGSALRLQFDGGSRGNPGRAGAGAVLFDGDTPVWERAVYVGDKATNNEAEYAGLVVGLKEAVSRGASHVDIEGDSKLVIKTVSGQWNLKADNLKPLQDRARGLLRGVKHTLSHIPRAKNGFADALANKAMDHPSASCHKADPTELPARKRRK